MKAQPRVLNIWSVSKQKNVSIEFKRNASEVMVKYIKHLVDHHDTNYEKLSQAVDVTGHRLFTDYLKFKR
jgi:hypothetical protein